MKFEKLLETMTNGPARPDRPFLIEGQTFGQVFDQAESIKAALKRAGSMDAPVCLCTENRGLMTAALLAALTGGWPVLLPHAYTTQTLMDAHRILPFTHALVEGDYGLPAGVTAVPLPVAHGMTPATGPMHVMEPDATWVYLFTGGSTGSPRIWSKSARNLLLESANLAEAFGIDDGDAILASVPPNHIYGLLYSVLLPLVSGAGVSVRTPSFPSEIVQAMDEIGATVFVSIPAHYRALKATSIPGRRIRIAFSSAGALSEQDDREFFESTGIAVTEIYGSTETGGIAYRRRCAGQTALKPFSYVDVRIDGEQLGVKSDFLSAELQKDESGYFLATDRVALVNQTEFEILGRTDGVVKVGGKRVDLANTRQVIMDIPGVEDAYVYTIPVKSGRENEIIAMVAGSVDSGQIVEAAKRSLPPYAWPRRVKVVEQIPLSATGKYNRDAIEKIMSHGQDQATTENPKGILGRS